MKRGRGFLGVVLVLALLACSKRRAPSGTPPQTSPSVSAASHRTRPPKTARELPTTSADIFLANLDGRIAELTRLTLETKGPVLAANARALASTRHTRGLFRGDPDEIQSGLAAIELCLAEAPSDALCHLMRAEQEQSLHRFKEARADLERARKLGADAVRSAELEAELDWNDGRYATAIEGIRRARRERPSSATWLREAQLDHDLGLEDASDAAFETAEDLVADTSPLPVAHLFVQRGMQLVDRGLLDDACLFFREAVSRMPTYVAANEHLAETLQALGKEEEATALYERVVQLSEDPEHRHSLAALYARSGRRDRARELEIDAHARYEKLLARYPEAMYWHASEFYLATGDRKRALELLQKNVALRPNGASYVALARVALANGKPAEAREAIDTALAMPVRSAELFWTASRVYQSVGDAASAGTFRGRALAMNPRVDGREAPDDAGTTGR